jgi:hypothetical protein
VIRSGAFPGLGALDAPAAPDAPDSPDSPDVSSLGRHPLHDDDRLWPETNCYVDLWIEVLHHMGLDPVPTLAFTLSTDFDGEQWEFFKTPLEDLRHLYGIEVHEINVWQSLGEHLERHLGFGNLLTMECDSWYLPDTAGVAYRSVHQKTAIAPAWIDSEGKRLGYFHNRGYCELEGDDFEGAMRADAPADVLAPYTELVRIERLHRPGRDELRARTVELVRQHLTRRPTTNPVRRMADRITADTAWLQAQPSEVFHAYAFGTLRQCGAWADLVATFVTWLDDDALAPAADAFAELSATTKTCQFKLARLASGRSTDLSGLFDSMSELWDRGYTPLLGAFEG